MSEIELLLPGPSELNVRYHYQPEMHRLELRLEAPEEYLGGLLGGMGSWD